MPDRPKQYRPFPKPQAVAYQPQAARVSAHKRGYGRKWQAARVSFLSKNPLCVECSKAGRDVSATVVDHVTPHKGDLKLFWDRGNWQALCETHHNAKTARQDGGFGHKPKGTK